MAMRLMPALVLAGLLVGCEEPEVAFCERYLRAGLAQELDYQRQDVSIRERLLDSLEAQRAVFPNYAPQTPYPRRPGKTAFLLDLLESYAVHLREVTIQYRHGPPGKRRTGGETCRFLRIAGNTQHISDLHLRRRIIKRAVAAESVSCCISTNERVR